MKKSIINLASKGKLLSALSEKNWLQAGSDQGEKDKNDRERQLFASEIRKR